MSSTRTFTRRELLGTVLATLLVGGLFGTMLGFYAYKVRYDPDTKVPQVIRTTAGKLLESEVSEVSLADLVTGKFVPTKARTRGRVTNIQREPDGDVHVVLGDDAGHRVVGEIIPQLPLPTPTEGTTIEVDGVTRYDIDHAWWEVHPVTAWHLVSGGL